MWLPSLVTLPDSAMSLPNESSSRFAPKSRTLAPTVARIGLFWRFVCAPKPAVISTNGPTLTSPPARQLVSAPRPTIAWLVSEMPRAKRCTGASLVAVRCLDRSMR